jgi:hypothetical protein
MAPPPGRHARWQRYGERRSRRLHTHRRRRGSRPRPTLSTFSPTHGAIEASSRRPRFAFQSALSSVRSRRDFRDDEPDEVSTNHDEFTGAQHPHRVRSHHERLEAGDDDEHSGAWTGEGSSIHRGRSSEVPSIVKPTISCSPGVRWAGLVEVARGVSRAGSLLARSASPVPTCPIASCTPNAP